MKFLKTLSPYITFKQQQNRSKHIASVSQFQGKLY